MSSRHVGVVIPAYQAEAFVLDAVRSVLAQTHRDLSLVVVDDGSTDRTAELVAAVEDPRVSVERQPNGGVGRARNRGAELVGGELIAFLDADDVWAPDKLERQIAALEQHPQWVAVGTFMDHIDAHGRRLGLSGEALGTEGRARVAAALLMPCPLSSLLFARPVFEALGGFDETLVKDVPAMVEDLDLMSRLAQGHDFGVLDQSLGGYRVHGGSGSAVHFRNQRDGARFLRERVARRRAGSDLTWPEFRAQQKASLLRWQGDTAAYLYRRAGLAAAERRWSAVLTNGAGAVTLGPRYSLTRLRRQRGKRLPADG